MPDTRQHRGAHPDDALLFRHAQFPTLRAAVSELSYLLSRGYALLSAVKLVGDRHDLNVRQRLALSRAACSDQARDSRRAHCLPIQQIAGQEIMIDGFNLLITLEAALSGGVILRCRDGCLRDLASVHGTYRSVAETEHAIGLIAEHLAVFRPQAATWLFDAPVSNSGRIAQHVRSEAARYGQAWRAETVMNPDAALAASAQIVISADSVVIDHAARWVNFSASLLETRLPDAWLIDLSS